MKKLTKILALTLTLALLACGFIIAASADEAGEATLLVSETGASLPLDYAETSVDYADIGRDVLYFYAPESVTSVSEGYKIVEGEGTPEGYKRWERLAYAIYDYQDKTEVHGEYTVAEIDNMSVVVSTLSYTNSKSIVVIMYSDINLNNNKVQNSGSGALFSAKGSILVDLNGYKLERTAASDLGATKQLALFNCAMSSKNFAVVSTQPGGEFVFYSPTGFSNVFNGQASGASSSISYYLGTYKTSFFKALGSAPVYHIDVTVAGVVHNSNSSAKTSSSNSIIIKDATVVQTELGTNENLFHNYTRTKLNISDSTLVAATGKSVFNFVSATTSGGSAGNHVGIISGSVIENCVISGEYIFKNLDCILGETAANLAITNSVLDGVLYGGTPTKADYVTLNAGCVVTLPEGYESCVVAGTDLTIEVAELLANADVNGEAVTVGGKHVVAAADKTFVVELDAITALAFVPTANGYKVDSVQEGKYTATPGYVMLTEYKVYDTEKNLVGTYADADEAYAALQAGYYIDVDVAPSEAAIPSLPVFYASTCIDAKGFNTTSPAIVDGYYKVVGAAYLIYDANGEVVTFDADATTLIATLNSFLADSNNTYVKLVLATDIDLGNDKNATLAGVFEVLGDQTLVVDLNGHTLKRVGEITDNGIFVLSPKSTLTIISSAPGGVLENSHTSEAEFKTLVSCNTTYHAGIVVNFGGFEGADGNNLTIKSSVLVKFGLTAGSASPHVQNFQNPAKINVKGGTYYCISTSTSTNANVFSTSTIVTFNIEDAVFFTEKGLIGQSSGTAYTCGVFDSVIKNTTIYGVKRDGTAANAVITISSVRKVSDSLSLTLDKLLDKLLEGTELDHESDEAVAFTALYNKGNDLLIEGCTIVGYLHSSTSVGTITLGKDNKFTGYVAPSYEAESYPIEIQLAEGVEFVNANVGVDVNEATYFLTVATVLESEKAEKVGSVVIDGGEAEEWLIGSVITAEETKAGVENVYSYVFTAWVNAAGEPVTVVAAGENVFNSVYQLVADVQGIKYQLVANNGFVIKVYIPKNDAITPAGEFTVEDNGEGVECYCLTFKVSVSDVEALVGQYTVTDGEQTATDTVSVTLAQYFNDALAEEGVTEATKALIANAANYCNEAYKYANGVDNYAPYAEIVAAYADYIKASVQAPAQGFENEVIIGVAIYVGGDQKPVLVFERAAGSAVESIKVVTAAGETDAVVKEMFGTYFFVADVDVEYLADDVKIVVEGAECVYNLATYIATEGSTAELAAAILGYAEAAKVYNAEANAPVDPEQPEGNDPEQPEGNDPEQPEGNDPEQQPEGTDPEQQPEGNDPEQQPEGTDPEQQPEGNDPEQQPEGNDPVGGEEQTPAV